MADEKIKVLEEKNIHLWFEESPLAVCAAKLALDIDKAELFACVKLMNLQPDNLKSLVFDVLCYDSVRQLIDTIQDVSYTGFDVTRNTEFAYNRRVTVKNQQTRSVEFVLKKVVTVSDHVWFNNENRHFDTSLEQNSIFSAQGNLNKQFIEICTRSNIDGSRFSFEPVFTDSHWLCGCGCFNWENEEVCFNCGVGKSWLARNCKIEVLQKQADFESQQKMEFQEQHRQTHNFQQSQQDKQTEIDEFARRNKNYKKQLQKQALKKHSRVLLLILLILAVIGAIVCGVIFFGLPYLKYTSAVNDFEMYRYNEALTKFTELGDFLESREFCLKSTYGLAFSLSNSDNPEQSAELFLSLGNYKDSHDQYIIARYKTGEKKYHEGDYLTSAQIFESLGDYEDAAANYYQCVKMIYRDAQTDMITNTMESLQSAYDKLSYIIDYKKSKILRDNCVYYMGNIDYSEYRYLDAIEKYKSVPDNEDAVKKLADIQTLADLISTAAPDKNAVWQSDMVHCTDCTKNNAVYFLELSGNGNLSLYAKCADTDKTVFSEKGSFKIEKNTIFLLDSQENQWEELLKITSLKKVTDGDNGNAVFSANMVNTPDENVTSLTFHGSVN